MAVKSKDVDAAIVSIDYHKMGAKTLVGLATLKNGYEIVESSSCVDPARFSESIGKELIQERVRMRVWEMLGFKDQDDKAETPVTLSDDEAVFEGDE